MEIADLQYVALKGEGYFCTVKKYTDKSTGNNYALKELKEKHYSRDDYRFRLLREIRLLGELQGCENIIRLISSGNHQSEKKLWYLMPFADTNLYNFIKTNNGSLAQAERYNIIEQLIHAIKFAHDKGILHRDISPSNVLVFFQDGTPVIKFSDFGLGKDIESISHYTSSSASGYGQILYVSPEQKAQLKDATAKSDIFSLGKLVYFVFTGKDPISIQAFELASLVSKATEENPENRFQTIGDFEAHFKSLKDLHLNHTIPIEHITLKDILSTDQNIDMIHLHELFVKGTFSDHVYYDYIEPVNNYLLSNNNISKYYNAVGAGVREFLLTYSDRLKECFKTIRWPFSSSKYFGEVLVKFTQIVQEDESRLICLKQLWFIGFEADQWDVQNRMKSVFNSNYITDTIKTQLAEFILASETEMDVNFFASSEIPSIIKHAIIKSNDTFKDKRNQREVTRNNLFGDIG